MEEEVIFDHEHSQRSYNHEKNSPSSDDFSQKIARCLWNMKSSIPTGHDYPWLAKLAMTGLIGLTGQVCANWLRLVVTVLTLANCGLTG